MYNTLTCNIEVWIFHALIKKKQINSFVLLRTIMSLEEYYSFLANNSSCIGRISKQGDIEH